MSKSIKKYLWRSIFIISGFAIFIIIALFLTAHSKAKLISPLPTLLLEDQHEFYLAQISDDLSKGFGYWETDIWSERMVDATLILEDKRFWDHSGVDLYAIVRAFYQNLTSGQRLSGASTIAMQIARMQNPRKRSYVNKAVEAATAILITLRYDRRDIMRHYLKIVPYGNQFHGIAYASRRYFNKPYTDLSWAEIAALSAIPQSPTFHNPLKYDGRLRVTDRGKRILSELEAEGLITAEQYDLAVEQITDLNFIQPEKRPASLMHGILKMSNLLTEQRKLGLLNVTDPRIKSTLSLPLQNKVQELSSQFLEQWRRSGAENVSVVVLKKDSNEVLAWLGSINYFSAGGGAIDYASTLRSPGSTLKPFIYGLALDRGEITPATVLPDLQSFARQTSNADKLFLGPMLPRQALANSRNIPAINIVRALGIEESYLYLEELKLNARPMPASHYGAGIAVGAMPTTLGDLTRAYGVIANDGLLQNLTWYQGQSIEPAKQVMTTESARQISLFLSDPLARLPSFPRMGTTEYPFPVAVKTGTSQGYRDAWTVAYTNDYIVGVWVGRSDAKPMRELGGAASAAALVREIILHLYKDTPAYKVNTAFAHPVGYQQATLCALTGKIADPQCKVRFSEWLPSDQVPDVDDSYRALDIDVRNGLLAGAWTPAEQIVRRSFRDFPFKYQQWATQQGYTLAPRFFSPLNNPNSGTNAIPANFNALENLTNLSSAEADGSITLKIISPDNNLFLFKLPEVPEQMNKLAFNIDVNTEIDEVLWYVDDLPYELTKAPFTLRWPLEGGKHEVYAEVPYYGITSQTITVNVTDQTNTH